MKYFAVMAIITLLTGQCRASDPSHEEPGAVPQAKREAQEDSLDVLMRSGLWSEAIVVADSAILVARNRVWGPGSRIVLTYDAESRSLLAEGILLISTPKPRKGNPGPRVRFLNMVLDTAQAHPELSREDRVAYALEVVDGTGILDPRFKPTSSCCEIRWQYLNESSPVTISLSGWNPDLTSSDYNELSAEEYCREYAGIIKRSLEGAGVSIRNLSESSEMLTSSRTLFEALTKASRGQMNSTVLAELRSAFHEPEKLIFTRPW